MLQKQLLIIGGFGYEDAGDEAQLSTVLTNLRQQTPGIRFLILSDTPKNTRKWHHEATDYSINHYLQTSVFVNERHGVDQEQEMGESKLPNFANFWLTIMLSKLNVFANAFLLVLNAKRIKNNQKTLFLKNNLSYFLSILKNSDLLFNVGGGNITSTWPEEFHSKCVMIILCRILDKPIILSGQTIGPFKGVMDKFLARLALNQVSLITLREKFSEKTLRDLGVNHPIITLAGDDSTTLIPHNDIKLSDMLNSTLKNPKKQIFVGMNLIGLHYLKDNAKMEKSKILLAELANHLISKFDARIFFVSTQYSNGNDDRVAGAEIKRLIKDKNRFILLQEKYDEHLLKAIVSQFDFVIGFRYHFIVFALNSGVPAIGLYLDDYYSCKIRGILDLVGFEENAINVEKITFESLRSLAEKTLLNKVQISEKLKMKTKNLEYTSLLSIRIARKILMSSP